MFHPPSQGLPARRNAGGPGNPLPGPRSSLVVPSPSSDHDHVKRREAVEAHRGVAGGVGAGTGGTLVFLLGRGGRRFFPGLKHYSVDEAASNTLANRFVSWAQNRGSVVVFIMSAMLNPAFAPMAIAMGALRFRLIKFFLMCVAGNLVKAIIISYAGYLGVGTLIRWLGGL